MNYKECLLYCVYFAGIVYVKIEEKIFFAYPYLISSLFDIVESQEVITQKDWFTYVYVYTHAKSPKFFINTNVCILSKCMSQNQICTVTFLKKHLTNSIEIVYFQEEYWKIQSNISIF